MVRPAQNSEAKRWLQRRNFAATQQQKINYTCKQTQALFCAIPICSFFTRFLSCTKSCHTPSSATKWSPIRKFLPLRRWNLGRGHSYWPFPSNSHNPNFATTLYNFVFFICLWWPRGQSFWPFAFTSAHICWCRSSPSSTLIFVFINSLISPPGQRCLKDALAHRLAYPWASKNLHAPNHL